MYCCEPKLWNVLQYSRQVTGAELALATVCFAFQIYCDFSGFADIAVGTAKLFGIHLMRNFAYPYFAQSILNSGGDGTFR